MAARKKSTFQKAQASVMKAIRGLEKSVSEMVSFDEGPRTKKKAKKLKTSKSRSR